MEKFNNSNFFLRKLFLLISLLLTGCGSGDRAPEILILSSYFPSWLVASVISVPITVIFRFAMIKAGVDDYLPFRFVVYVCIWLIICMAIYYINSPL